MPQYLNYLGNFITAQQPAVVIVKPLNVLNEDHDRNNMEIAYFYYSTIYRSTQY